MRQNGQPRSVSAAVEEDDTGAYPGGGGAMALMGQGRTLTRTQTQFTGAIAVQKERKPDEVLKKALFEAGQMGEDFFYAWTVNDKNSPTGKSLIKGMSIDGAMVLARLWGNCGIPVEVAEDAPSHWILNATFLDLETGFAVQRLFRQRKSESHGKFDNERALDIAFQIGQSKAQRNVIDKAMPAWLVNKCMDQATNASESKYADERGNLKPNVVKTMIDAFARFDVTQAMLEKKIERPIDKWEPRDLVALAALGRSIKDRVTTVDQEFPKEEQPKATGGEAKADADGVVSSQTPTAPSATTPTEPAPANQEETKTDAAAISPAESAASAAEGGITPPPWAGTGKRPK